MLDLVVVKLGQSPMLRPTITEWFSGTGILCLLNKSLCKITVSAIGVFCCDIM